MISIVCLAYNENDAKYGAELFYIKGYKGKAFTYSIGIQWIYGSNLKELMNLPLLHS